MRTQRSLLTVVFGSVAALSGCSLDFFGPDGPGPDNRVAEVHGKFVASVPARPGTTITWSASGEEFTFVSADLRIAHAHHPQSGTTRQLYAATLDREQTYDAALFSDGVEWLTTSSNPADLAKGLVLRRHTVAGSTVLTDRVAGGPFQSAAWARGILVAPGPPAAAFIVRPDSLFFLRSGVATLLGTGCLGIVAFSPDEKRVLCKTGGWPASFPESFGVFRIDGGATEPLTLSPAVSAPHAIRWGPQGVQVVYGGYPDGYLVFDQASGASRPFSPGPKYPESLGGTVSWSSNGGKAAYWTHYCGQTAGLFSCASSQAALYLLDVATRTTKRIAVHGTDSYAQQVAVSPDGSMVAYTINGGLYVLDAK